MAMLIAFVLTWVSWTCGRLFAGFFPASRPPKIACLGFGLVAGFVILGVLMLLRRGMYQLMIRGDSVVTAPLQWFHPFDPPFLFLYCFFAYGGAASFYKRPRP